MRTSLAALTLASLLAACAPSERGRARIDLGDLVEHAAQSNVRITRIELRVHGAGMDVITVDVPIDTLEFDFEVPAGAGRTFVVEAYEASDAGEAVTYWGETIADVPSQGTIDLVIPVFRAGVLVGSVEVFGGVLPEDVVVRFIAAAPLPDAPAELTAQVFGGFYARPLPIGAYSVALEIDGLSLVGAPVADVRQGEMIFLPLYAAAAGYCDPALGLTPDADGDGSACDVDCDDGDGSRNVVDADEDGVTSCDGDCDDANATCLFDCTDGDGDGTCAERDCDDSFESGFVCADGCMPSYVDADGDGFGDASTAMPACVLAPGRVANDRDCNDTLALCNTDAGCVDEDFDGACVDHDCDDRGAFGITCTADCGNWFADSDGDGAGDSNVPYYGCPPSGYVASGGDCDDSPTTGSACTTGCAPMHADSDGDTYGDASIAYSGCPLPGYVTNGADCDDGKPQCNTDAGCVDADFDGACTDHDCDDGATFGGGCTAGCGTWYLDQDGDGTGDSGVQYFGCQPSGYVAANGDCDDSLGTGSACTTGCAPMHADSDGDTYGDASIAYSGCPLPGYVTNGADCDDGKPQCNTDAGCVDADFDGACTDHDCDDGATFGGGCTAGCGTWYLDQDGDGDGNSEAQYFGCQPAGYVAANTDCDDSLGTGSACTTGCAPMHADSDGDTYGDASVAYSGCPLAGYVTNGADCDDTKPDCNTDAGCIDADFDGACTDHDCDDGVSFGGGCTTGCGTWYADQDGDGVGQSEVQYFGCQPSGYSATNTDCDDSAETGFSCVTGCGTWFIDADGDTFGDPAVSYNGCLQTSYVGNGSDCDDTKPLCNTDAGCVDADLDGACVDHDCDDSPTGDGCTSGCGTFFLDLDRDGHGDPAASLVRCTAPASWVSTNDDCDDRDPDLWSTCGACADADGDGHFTGCNQYVRRRGPDCAPADASVSLGQAEKCDDGKDNNCNGQVDVADPACSCPDNDGDGYRCGDCDDTAATGAPHTLADNDGDGQTTCSVPVDCNDANPAVNGRAFENCRAVAPGDEDCDGLANGADPDCACADTDGDGFCPPLDCDDTDAALTPLDKDGDGYSSCRGDCDDESPHIHPGTTEQCFDTVDNDCDALADAQDPQCEGPDTDNDGYVLSDCSPTDPGANWADRDLDRYTTCGATPDCSGDASPDLIPYDVDGDGWSSCDGDCDDGDASVTPVMAELCDKRDNDCDGQIDEGCASSDSDGIPDELDNCPTMNNPDQMDTDNDGVGNACETVFGCENDPERAPTFVENCWDPSNKDEDCDGQASGTGMNNDAGCATRGSCTTAHDADGDLWPRFEAGCTPPFPDLDDGNGATHPNVKRELGQACSDGKDNDDDGLIDGSDLDCTGLTCSRPAKFPSLLLLSKRDEAFIQADSCRLPLSAGPVGACTSSQQAFFAEVRVNNDFDADMKLHVCSRSEIATEVLVAGAPCSAFSCVGPINPFQCTTLDVPGSGLQIVQLQFRAASQACGPFKRLAWELRLAN